MSYELIISEKPQAAAKIAAALNDKGTPAKHRELGVNYFAIVHNGKPIRVGSAVGHLYGLAEKGGESWSYPVFETEWKPTYKTNKQAKYTKDYLNALIKLGKDADEVTIASDFDIEGEVIGLNIVKHALKREDANRMKFSTLTKPDLIKAYENKQPHLEWGQAKAGETRHTLDWFYGINLSRAFTESIKKATRQFKVLSTGRVQAPALHFLAERERKILAFKPEKFSEIYLDGECKSTNIKAQYELPISKVKELQEENEEGEETKVKDRFKIFDESWANVVVSETKGKNGKVSAIESKQFKQNVPFPFDLTSLQMEASTMLGFSPKRTLELAQKLYIDGVTSYPRTSSQKLPKELNLKNVLTKLKGIPIYKNLVEKVETINPSLKPNEGKKEDPAHPAIHPTGEIPKKLEGQEQKLYDLIVKRFFAVFGKPAIRETNTIAVEINSHKFILKGTRTVEKNWHELYEPYLKFEDVELPKLEKGSEVINKKIEKKNKETTPPRRYTDASIIRELEKRNLGTKATRAEILSQLKNRGYITGKSIQVTELGLKMDEVLASDVPKLVDEALTRQFEEDMEKIREDKQEPEKVLARAKENLKGILSEIKEKEIELGRKLTKASNLAEREMSIVGTCPKCGEGKLVVRFSPKLKKKFIACDKYPNCKTIFNAPQAEIIRGIPDQPQEDGSINVLAGKSENSLRKVCINPKQEESPTIEEEGMQCPNCSEGKMLLRNGMYGQFLGCSNYPKCKTIFRIIKGKVIIPKPKKEKKEK
ncbi:MAG: DNA topoisomerase I [Nanoarchaeota archaeon]